MNRLYTLVIISILSTFISSLGAQDFEEEYFVEKKQGGFVFSMAETGSGLGGFFAWPILDNLHLGLTLDVFFIRDSRQLDFYDPFYGPISINKENNVYLFDFLVTLKRRFFTQDLEDSFRPFLTGAIGPYYGMNFPEADQDTEGNKLSDEYRWTLGGYVGSGVDISVNTNMFVSIRAQYRIIPFSKTLGERTNHSMFELRFEVGQRF
jgi:hypothetical protein